MADCIPASVSLPLLGMPGDSPILPVRVHGQDAAMFFSPGFVPLLFRDNGPVSFPEFRRVDLRLQDGDLKPADREAYLLPGPEDRHAGGRPIVGMLGRDILPEGAVVVLDIPRRRVTLSTPPAACPTFPQPAPARSIDMRRDVLTVPARIDGQPVQAVLEPDLPVSILPGDVARRLGVSDADLANDPSVVTKFGKACWDAAIT